MRSKLFAALLLSIIATLASADHISCKVVGVSDGDTFTCLDANKKQTKVRMAEIDTAESKQPYGTRSRQALSDSVVREAGRRTCAGNRSLRRSVGRVHVGDVDVNAELVNQGAAWVYCQYSKDKSLLVLEDQARKAKRGPWALPESERMPPWEWAQSCPRSASGAA